MNPLRREVNAYPGTLCRVDLEIQTWLYSIVHLVPSFEYNTVFRPRIHSGFACVRYWTMNARSVSFESCLLLIQGLGSSFRACLLT